MSPAPAGRPGPRECWAAAGGRGQGMAGRGRPAVWFGSMGHGKCVCARVCLCVCV